jgi:uncharacterized protein YdeI (YjbR/CyaY-like superfamily)
MAESLITLDVRTQVQWRQWLAKHHTSSPGIWLVRYKEHTGVKSMPYEDLVREALCFGWIDSLIKRLDDDRYAIKVTPRKATSKWSNINRTRWKELKATGQLTAAGLAAAPTGKHLWLTSFDPGAAELHSQSTQDEPWSMATLSGACPDVPA